jgi:ribokinase
MSKTLVIVIGTINTDIVAVAVKDLASPGNPKYGGHLKIGPGGKSRNAAQMAAVILDKPGSVAMIGRTAEDKNGLWKIPIDALEEVNVNTSYIKVIPEAETSKAPSVAINAVTKEGVNASYIVPGISDDFSKEDIDAADELFNEASENNGIFAMSLECPLETAEYAIAKASDKGLRIILDLGGMEAYENIDNLISDKIYLLKPNEHEAKAVTGIEITDFNSAKLAARNLLNRGVQNILITVGSEGAYLFNDKLEKHIPIPSLTRSDEKDDTGCGDQAMAALCAFLQEGRTLEETAALAVLAGSLEFQRVGIVPITKQEIDQVV